MKGAATPLLVAVIALLTGCASVNENSEPTISLAGKTADGETADGEFPEILEVEATYDPAGTSWTFAVTVSSPYDTPQRYADGWRVVGADDTLYGVHTLTHDHAGEQPFTRRQSGVEIPDDVAEVTIEGRDLVNGFGGTTLTIDLETAQG